MRIEIFNIVDFIGLLNFFNYYIFQIMVVNNYAI
jgi:hypothetical protein